MQFVKSGNVCTLYEAAEYRKIKTDVACQLKLIFTNGRSNGFKITALLVYIEDWHMANTILNDHRSVANYAYPFS